MIDGFWTVEFHGPQGSGGGVAIFMNGRVLGGDSGFTYAGTYQTKGNALQGKVSVKNFMPSVPSVLGIIGDYDLLIEGTVEGDKITGTGALASAPDAKIVVRLTKASNLP